MGHAELAVQPQTFAFAQFELGAGLDAGADCPEGLVGAVDLQVDDPGVCKRKPVKTGSP